jgi:hypothetical protein
VFEERFNAGGFDHVPSFHCRDHEMLLLEIPLKVQGISMKKIFEHISCGARTKGSICIHGLGEQVYDRHGYALRNMFM